MCASHVMHTSSYMCDRLATRPGCPLVADPPDAIPPLGTIKPFEIHHFTLLSLLNHLWDFKTKCDILVALNMLSKKQFSILNHLGIKVFKKK